MRVVTRLVRGCRASFFACVVASVAVVPAARSVAGTPFRVSDSIAMTTILRFSADGTNPNPIKTALFSPDGSQFLLHTRRGDVKRDLNVESLLLYKTAEVARYVKEQDAVAPPTAVTLAQIDLEDDWGAMSSIQWLDPTTVGFISSGTGRVNQAYIADTRTRKVVQLTHSGTDVASFTASGDTVLFYAYVVPKAPQVVSVEGKSWAELLFSSSDVSWKAARSLELFVMSRSTGVARRVANPVFLAPNDRQIWLSPSRRLAVVLTPAVNAPAHWAEYQTVTKWLSYAPENVVTDPTSRQLMSKTRYALVDVKTGALRVLLDAPSGALSGASTPAGAFWPQDERSVILSNTYLPLDSSDPATRSARAAQPAVAEVDLASNALTRILWTPAFTAEQRASNRLPESTILSVDFERHDNTLLVTQRSVQTRTTFYETYRKSHGSWERISSAPSKQQDTLAVDLRQSLTERPRVYASVTGADGRKLLLDPNPQLDQFAFGVPSILNWTDANGIEWQGTLLLPPDYVEGRRYPLVVQTHGFSPDEFLIDGPYGGTVAMAAQAFAGAGIVVLQVQDKGRLITDDAREGPGVAEGYRAAIETLIARGIADAGKVGLIGFSRTGYHTLHVLARYPDLLAAATICDSIQRSYGEVVLEGDFHQPGRSNLDGGPPDVTRIGEWFARNPLYQLTALETAVRIEANGPSSLLAMWETYSVLHSYGRAIDYVYFPEGSHVVSQACGAARFAGWRRRLVSILAAGL